MGYGHPDIRGEMSAELPSLSSIFEMVSSQELAVFRRTADEEMVAIGKVDSAGAVALPEKGRQIFWRAFDVDFQRPGEEWAEFSRSYRFHPKVLLIRKDGQSAVSVVASSEQEWLVWRDQLVAPGQTTDLSQSLNHEPLEAKVHKWDEENFRSAVSRISDDRLLPKAVVARRLRRQVCGPLSVSFLLEELSEKYGQCTTFAISPGPQRFPVFIGATPERLAGVEDGQVSTMALAGTVGVDDESSRSAAEEKLLNSVKDREEHRFVRDMIHEELAPLCESFSAPESPQILRLANMSHLHTPMVGALAEEATLLEVVDALHPTPAVCGTPRDKARAFIADHEGFDRGLYAGVLGWVDQSGDGVADVLLRAALVDEEGATIYAGAGITADSDIDREWEETSRKCRPLLDAIGEIEGRRP